MQGKKANISQEKLKELMQEHTLIEIAEILNVSISTIKRYKKKYGLEINKEISRQRNSIKHSIYNYDLTYFEKIDNMNKAYLLGFICADGYLTTGRNEFGITVSEKDKNIIEFFKQQLKTNKPIVNIEDKNNHKAVELRINNIKLYQDIQKYGITPKKSLTINIENVIQLAELNEKQISVFLLGYFDGDGCISLAHRKKDNKPYFEMNVLGTLETINYFKQYFNNHGSIRQNNINKNNYTLQISNNFKTIYNSLKKLYQYKDELDYYYERKYNLFKKLENKVLLNSDI